MKYKLGELIESVSKTYDFSNKDSIIFVNTSDIFDGVITGKETKINELPGQAKKSIKHNDILFSEIRPKNKRFAMVTDIEPSNYVVSTKLMVLRNKKEKVLDTKYLYLYLTSPTIISYLQSEAESRSGTFPQITFKDNVSNIEINLPSLYEQHEVVRKIGTIINKIKLNKQINANLFKLSNIIFESIIQNEQPTIKFSKIATIQNGFAFKSKEYVNDKQTLVLRTKNIGSDHLFNKDDIVYISNKSFNNYKKFTFKPFDTTLVMVGASIGKTGFITSNVIPSLQNQNMWRFRSNKLPGLLIYEYVTFINKNVKNAATGSARSFYRKELFNDFNVPFIDAVYFPIFDKLQQELDNLNGESETLKKLRNVLMNRYF